MYYTLAIILYCFEIVAVAAESCLCRGQDNVMGIEGCIRGKEIVVMVMPYFEHDRFQVSRTRP
jgi:hypothetical protein